MTSADGAGVFRGLTRHGLMYALGVVASKAVAVIMLPVYTRYLTPADYGTLQLITMTVEVVSIAAGSRIALGIFHHYHKYEALEERRVVLSSATILLAATFAGASALTGVMAPWISDVVFSSRGMNVVFIRLAAAALAFEGAMLVPMAYLQLKRQSGLFVAVNLIKLTLQLVLNVVLLVPLGLGVLGVLISSFASNVVLGVALVTWLIRDVGFRVQPSLVGSFLRFGVPLMGMQIATLLITFGDRFFLNRAAGQAEVGLYGLAYQFGFLLFGVGYAPMERVWDPERFAIARRPDRDALYARAWRYTNLLLLTFAVGLALFAGDVLRLVAAPAFHRAAAYVPVILVAYVFLAWTVFHNFGTLVKERTELYTLATWAGAGVALAGYLVLVPRFQAMGAAFTAVASLGTRFGLTYYFSHRLFPIRYQWGPVLRQCAAAVGVSLISVALPRVELGWSIGLHSALFLGYGAVVLMLGGLRSAERAAIGKFFRTPLASLRGVVGGA